MAISQGLSKVTSTEAVGADDRTLACSLQHHLHHVARRAVAPIGVLPMVSTARAAIQQAKAAVGIIAADWRVRWRTVLRANLQRLLHREDSRTGQGRLGC